jgi:diguanylate cyclase (GGDEF)-like protein
MASGRHDAIFFDEMWKEIHTNSYWEGELWNKRKNGEIYPQKLTVTAVKDSNDIVTNYVGTLIDITKTKQAEQEIEDLAYYDSLTRLPNRRLMMDRINHAMAKNIRSEKIGALLFLDLDYFKTLNDTLGHDMGDILLQQVATRLTSCIRENDTVSRFGGDEFVVLLEDLSELSIEAAEQAEDIANKFLNTINQPFHLNNHIYSCSTSIGITLFTGRQSGVDELLKQADIAMYQAKNDGRNGIRFFNPQMQTKIAAHAKLESDLKEAIELQQFQLYYQIQVDNDLNPIGCEALIRWVHPQRGIIPPLDFIPLAEQNGSIRAIGRWVIDTACAQLNVWQHDRLTCDLTLSVNVSAKQFHQPDFISQITTAVERHKINPALLKLELTESLLLSDIEDTIAKMKTLAEINIQFSLDDFGTGYSSLQYLKKLPLYQLKIDKSFIDNIVADSDDQSIVKTIIVMAHSLGLNVIAEGVETKTQQQLLLTQGCTHYQGYLYSKPVPVEQFDVLLRQLH